MHPGGGAGGGEKCNQGCLGSSEASRLAVAWLRARAGQALSVGSGAPFPRILLRRGVKYAPTLRVSADLLDLEGGEDKGLPKASSQHLSLILPRQPRAVVANI